MSWLTSSMCVRRRVYLRTFGGYQVLLREWRLFGIKVWTTEVDREEYPSWADIAKSTLGHTEWTSRFAEYIK